MTLSFLEMSVTPGKSSDGCEYGGGVPAECAHSRRQHFTSRRSRTLKQNEKPAERHSRAFLRARERPAVHPLRVAPRPIAPRWLRCASKVKRRLSRQARGTLTAVRGRV